MASREAESEAELAFAPKLGVERWHAVPRALSGADSTGAGKWAKRYLLRGASRSMRRGSC